MVFLSQGVFGEGRGECRYKILSVSLLADCSGSLRAGCGGVSASIMSNLTSDDSDLGWSKMNSGPFSAVVSHL